MEDDDLDLDLEPIKRPQKPAISPKPAEPVKAAASDSPVPAAKPAPGAKPAGVSALPARKRSPLAKATEAVAAPFKALRLPACNARSAAWGLVGLLILVVLGGNWQQVRINLFGIWFIDPPKPLAFLVDVAIGAAIALLWQRAVARRAAEAQAADAKSAESKTEPAATAGDK